jgi:hypothetical protein
LIKRRSSRFGNELEKLLAWNLIFRLPYCLNLHPPKGLTKGQELFLWRERLPDKHSIGERASLIPSGEAFELWIFKNISYNLSGFTSFLYGSGLREGGLK